MVLLTAGSRACYVPDTWQHCWHDPVTGAVAPFRRGT
jgi:hypothetical protein